MPKNSLTGRDLRNAILFAALLYLALKFIADIVDVILVFSIIAILVVALNPIVSWMEKHKIPRGVGAILLAVGFIASSLAVFYLMLPSLEKQMADLWKELPAFIAKTNKWASEFSESHPTIARYIPTDIGSIKGSIGQFSRSLLGGISQVTRSTISLIAGAILIFVGTIYSLANPKPLADGFLRAVKPEHRERVKAAGERLSTQIRAWALGNLIAMFLIFLLTWGGLTLVGLKQAFLFGVIAGIFEAIPIVGPILSAVLPTITALTQSPITALWVILTFTIIQQVENHVLIPQIMSRQVQLHPVTIIFAVLVMGGLFGLVGVFLATPAAVTAGILYDELYLCEYEQRCKDAANKEQLEENTESED